MGTPMSGQGSAETRDVEAANRAYYDALTNRDLSAMEKVWSRAPDNMVIAPPVDPHAHMGWAAIVRYWNAYWPTFAEFNVSMQVTGVSINGPVAWVNGIETSHRRTTSGETSSSRNYGTNIFVSQDGRWLMAFHQSALIPDDAAEGA
jgi:ketosteroid isomerase-like protein